MIGEIIILIRLTNPVPSGFSSLAKSAADRNPTAMPSSDGDDHGEVQVLGAVPRGGWCSHR